MFYISGVAITFFLIVLLIGKKDKSTADIILACWLAVIGFHLLLFYFFITGKIYSMPWMLAIHFPMPLLHGPLLYLYAAELTGNRTSKIKSLLHFVPAMLCYVYLIPFFLLPDEQKVDTFRNGGKGYETFMQVLIAAVFISGIVYVVLTTLLHRKHKRKIQDQFSNTEKINLDWIQYLMVGIGIIWLLVIFTDDIPVFTAVVLFVLFMGFFGIRQTPVFTANIQKTPITPTSVDKDLSENNRTGFEKSANSPNTENEIKVESEKSAVSEPLIESMSEKEKYKKSGLEADEIKRIHSQLTELMEREKLYTNPELTLGETAQQLDVHPNYLSQVINSVAKKNFYDYINSQRVEEFNRLARDEKNQKFTLLSLAYECGFNSKTSFNRNFRKVTGLSPSEFLRQENVSLSRLN